MLLKSFAKESILIKRVRIMYFQSSDILISNSIIMDIINYFVKYNRIYHSSRIVIHDYTK